MYKQPPKQHQFKKGISGNPRGRPKVSDSSLLELTSSFFQALLQARNRNHKACQKLKKIKEILNEK